MSTAPVDPAAARRRHHAASSAIIATNDALVHLAAPPQKKSASLAASASTACGYPSFAYNRPMDDVSEKTPERWKVFLSKKVEKQLAKLPEDIYLAFAALRLELKFEGPIQPEWQNFGKLKGKHGEYYHCHLNKGRPRYVAVWEIITNNINFMEVVFVGPHGSVNYGFFH